MRRAFTLIGFTASLLQPYAIDMGQTPSTPVPSTTVVYLPPPPPPTVSPILYPVMFSPSLISIPFPVFPQQDVIDQIRSWLRSLTPAQLAPNDPMKPFGTVTECIRPGQGPYWTNVAIRHSEYFTKIDGFARQISAVQMIILVPTQLLSILGNTPLAVEIPSEWWGAIPAALTWRYVLSALEEEVIRRVAQMPPAHRFLKMQQRGLDVPAQYTPVHQMVQEGFTTFIASIPEYSFTLPSYYAMQSPHQLLFENDRGKLFVRQSSTLTFGHLELAMHLKAPHDGVVIQVPPQVTGLPGGAIKFWVLSKLALN